MKVLVLWEDPHEQDEAENLANVLVSLSPTLAGAQVDNGGEVIIRAGSHQALPKVHVRAMSLRDAPPATPEHAEYVAALERAVFKMDVPQPDPVIETVKYTEYRSCSALGCHRDETFVGASEHECNWKYEVSGWQGSFCPTHRHLARRAQRGVVG